MGNRTVKMVLGNGTRKWKIENRKLDNNDNKITVIIG